MLSSIGEAINERNSNLCGDIILNEKNISFEKYSLRGLDIELTRKCNLSCKHCARGKAQNVTMTAQIIDRMFSQIKNVTGMILLTGGEVTLEMDILEYFLSKFIKSDWNPDELQISTNGICVDTNQRLIELLCKTVKEKNIFGSIFISDDVFHAECDKENLRYKSLDYFKSEVEKRGMLFDPNNPDDDKGKVDVFVRDLKGQDGKDTLIAVGNASEYMEEAASRGIKFGGLIDDELFECNNHKIQIVDGVISCRLTILANGNISIWQIYDYIRADKYCLGNILSENFKTIIDKHNTQNAIYQCYESKNYMNFRAHEQLNRDLPKSRREWFRFMELRYKLTFKARQDALRLYPELSADEIVALFPVPTEYEWLMMPEFSNYGTPQTPREAINIITNCMNDYGIYSSPRDYRENAIRIIVDEYISQKS